MMATMATLTVRVDRVPEVMSALRAEMARLLREAALDEDQRTGDRLREIAAMFEAGVTEADR